MRGASPFASPRKVNDITDCHFYHTIDLPGYGTMNGEWDLRGKVDEYLGFVPLKGKSVLEVGTADGYLCFEMEKRGASIIGYDLSEEHPWDVVPYGGIITEERTQNRRKTLRGLNNAWWLAHELFKSNAQVVYGTVYNVPQGIGSVDIATFGSILLHLRDPFLALQNAASLARESIVVTDLHRDIVRYARLPFLPKFVREKLSNQFLYAPVFMPNPETMTPWDRWWAFTPELIERFLKILGFARTRVTYSKQKFTSVAHPISVFTVIGSR
jgi:hypothetical protein